MRQATVLIGTLFVTLLPPSFAQKAQIIVVGGLTREATVQPGTTLEGKILLTNTGNQPRQVKVYQTDYWFTADGSTHYDECGSVPRSNGRWITVTPTQLTVPADSTEAVNYVIHVPQDPALVGTYWSMVMVEPLSEDAPEVAGLTGDQPAVAIRTIMRYGIQIITDLGTTGERSVKFLAKELTAVESRYFLNVDVENTGQRRLAPVVWAELFDAEGASVGRFEAQRQRLYPGCSARFPIELTGVPAGTYNALIVADNGDTDVFGVQAKIELK
ncbi:MAG: FxLYD domain-containing protein [Candidatus Zipacnadales bacterium]